MLLKSFYCPFSLPRRCFSMKTFILYVMVSAANCSPSWIPNGDFYTKQSCQKAASQLGAAAKPHHFKCIEK